MKKSKNDVKMYRNGANNRKNYKKRKLLNHLDLLEPANRLLKLSRKSPILLGL